MATTTIAVHWALRRMDVAACSRLAHRHFALLGRASPNLADWYEKGARKRLSPKVDVGSVDALERRLAKGLNRRDIDGAPISELGWSLGLWNGDTGGWSSSTAIHCGLFSRNPNLSNAASVSVDGDLEASAAIALFRGLIEIWSPDKGFVRRNEGGVEQGWASYQTSLAARLWGRGERFAQGRLTRFE